MKLTLEEKLAHGGHPVLRWMMDNIYIRTDPAGNIKAEKEKSTEKIDGAIATIMGLDRAIRCGNDSGASVYDNRGIFVYLVQRIKSLKTRILLRDYPSIYWLLPYFMVLFKGKHGGALMRMFNYSAIKNQKWDSETLSLIAAIYKEAGKQRDVSETKTRRIRKLVEIAKVQSTEASNAIEGIVTTSTRIKQLVEEKNNT